MWGWHGHEGWGFGMMFLLGLIWLLTIGGIIFLVVWAVNKSRRTSDSPLDILNRRYAVGEISREEYERMKREISGS